MDYLWIFLYFYLIKNCFKYNIIGSIRIKWNINYVNWSDSCCVLYRFFWYEGSICCWKGSMYRNLYFINCFYNYNIIKIWWI